MNDKLQLYQETIAIWNNLCDLHKQLFEITSEEYLHLLSSEVEKVEDSIKEKERVISKIANTDETRSNLLAKINKKYSQEIDNFFELNNFFSNLTFEQKNKHLDKFNRVLKDLINNIQKQNKTNQLFINKAIMSLDKIKNAGAGNKNYSLYNSGGALKR
jgi:flagellar biosynthesis/type III secretory pathway chaperone